MVGGVTTSSSSSYFITVLKFRGAFPYPVFRNILTFFRKTIAIIHNLSYNLVRMSIVKNIQEIN